VGAGSQTVKKSTTAPRTESVMTYSISFQKRSPRRWYCASKVVVMDIDSSIASLCRNRGSASHLSLKPCKFQHPFVKFAKQSVTEVLIRNRLSKWQQAQPADMTFPVWKKWKKCTHWLHCPMFGLVPCTHCVHFSGNVI
jgi:hypothetical protein